MALVSLRNVSCTYAGTTRKALDRVDLEVVPGEVLLVAGATESGKTSLCRLVCGYFPHFYKGDLEGEALIDGHPLRNTELSELVETTGLVFQQPKNQITGSRFSVRGEVALGPENLGLDREQIRERVEEALSRTDLLHLAHRSPFSLSGGELQRTALACVLAMRPRLLALDDPLSQLDPSRREQALSMIRALADTGMAVILACPFLDEAVEIADRAAILHHGRIALYGKAREVAVDQRLPSLDVAAPLVTRMAIVARSRGLWPDDEPLPATRDQALAVLGRSMPGRTLSREEP